MTEQRATTLPYPLEYIVSSESWYGDGPDRDPSVHILKVDVGGVRTFRFEVVDRSIPLGVPAIQVRVFNDAFAVFTELAPFFAALATEQPSTLDDARGILDRLGAVDVTAE